jgi:hypothetical protein
MPQLIDALLRLPLLEAAQLREVIQHLPDPQAAAQEMLRRGWITQDQFSSLFPTPQPRPTRQDTTLIGIGDDGTPPDAGSEDWGLTLNDEVDWVEVPPDGTGEESRPEPQTVEAAPGLGGAADTPDEWELPIFPEADEDTASLGERDRGSLLRRRLGWACLGLLLGALVFGGTLAGMQFFRSDSAVPPVAHQEFREVKEKPKVPTDRREVTRPQVEAGKAEKVPGNTVVEIVRPPVPLRPPAGEGIDTVRPPEPTPPPVSAGSAKDEKVQEVERIPEVVEQPRVHVIHIRQGEHLWTVRYYLDKNGKVINTEVQRE